MNKEKVMLRKQRKRLALKLSERKGDKFAGIITHQ